MKHIWSMPEYAEARLLSMGLSLTFCTSVVLAGPAVLYAVYAGGQEFVSRAGRASHATFAARHLALELGTCPAGPMPLDAPLAAPAGRLLTC